jgi:NifB/MoaA-like Fe-S oxidoreductase
MAEEAAQVDGLSVEVRVVENTLFGSSITVSGLMSGRDIARVLGDGPADLAVLPRNAFGFEGERTLDEWTVAALEEQTGVPIRLGRTAADLVVLSTVPTGERQPC